jgi:membrane associated rhomboid family serine protease
MAFSAIVAPQLPHTMPGSLRIRTPRRASHIYTDPVTMLPVQDVVPSRTTPWVTLGLMGILTAVLVFELLLSEHAVRGLILSYGLVPAHVFWTAPLTSALLHYGILDAAVNVLALWIFGDNVEDRLGRGRYAGLLVAGAVLSGLIGARVSAGALAPIIGAGGAVGAVIGAYLVLLPRSRVLMVVPVWRGIDLVEIPAAMVVMAWVLLTGVTAGAQAAPFPGIPLSVTAQVSGLLTGAALARVLARPDRLRCAWWNVAPNQLPDLRRTSRDTSANSASSASN